MDTCKSDLINQLEFKENLSLYIINKLYHGKCFCTLFTHSIVFAKGERVIKNELGFIIKEVSFLIVTFFFKCRF